MTAWTVYTRSGCSLCEQMIGELADLLDPAAAAAVRVIDIEGDPELERKYAQRMPVLLADGEFVCAYRLDRERLRAYLAAER